VVERDLANSLLFNTFNNLNRLAGTAKYLKRHARHQPQRVLVRVLLDILESHSIRQAEKFGTPEFVTLFRLFTMCILSIIDN
jgi:hypothetical protein